MTQMRPASEWLQTAWADAIFNGIDYSRNKEVLTFIKAIQQDAYEAGKAQGLSEGKRDASHWLPIAEAPDNQKLLLRINGEEWIGYFNPLTEIALGGYWNVTGWRKHTPPKPTHFQPLPAPLETAAEGGV